MSATEFAGWFESGSPALDGVVKPADSTQNLTPNCPFYKWAEQMFLWLNSPAPASYGGGGGRIFASPAFFGVSPAAADGSRTFIPHPQNFRPVMGLRPAKPGPHGLPVIRSASGQFFEVARATPETPVRPVIRTAAGQMVEVSQVSRAAGGHLAFLGANNRPVVAQFAPTVPQPTPVLRQLQPQVLSGPAAVHQALPALRVVPARTFAPQILRKFVLNGLPIFINSLGQVIDVEPGQAETDGVLGTQSGSLVYYITSSNDLYAYFRTQLGATFNASTQFPTTKAAADAVVAFAQAHGKTIPDEVALAVETKSSWVEASSVPDPQNYITIEATIPTYDTSNPALWTPTGQKQAKLAMVGMHVVGSTAGHPEMVWASFEHVGNLPAAVYAYNSTTGQKTVAQNTAGTWLFASNGAAGPFNVEFMHADGNTVVADPANTVSPGLPSGKIAPSNTLREAPFGLANGGSPGSIAGSNTEVIAMNASVRAKLDPADVRGRYFMLGATWTIFGAPPGASNQVGTNNLANATIETYDQGTSAATVGSNCFSCHGTNTTAVSHVFGPLKPLF